MPRSDYQTVGPSPLHRRPRVQHCSPITKRRILGERMTGGFGDGERFPGQGRLVDIQIRRLEDAHIRRNAVASFEKNEIARHKLSAVYALHGSIPDGSC